eukprot:12416104-Alexandrium_andersonii.AAC.1
MASALRGPRNIICGRLRNQHGKCRRMGRSRAPRAPGSQDIELRCPISMWGIPCFDFIEADV